MAGRGAAGRVNQRSGTDYVQYRVGGTAAYAPERVSPGEVRTNSAAVERNREKALSVNYGYVIFLAFISIATVFMCVRYLKLKATITAQTSSIEKLESTLQQVRSENDALLENVNNCLDWNHIKDVAINEMDMKYATEDQIVWYNTEESSYIRQYSEVPSA